MWFWLIPIAPLIAFVMLVLVGAQFSSLAAGLTVGSVAISLAVSSLALVTMPARPQSVILPWLETGDRRLALALGLDPLASVVAVLVSVIAFVATVYAVTYMAGDRHRGRFFVYWTLFVGSMLTLVLAADLVTLFIAWEIVGLCSYLLIGFWFERPRVPAAASKALITTRIGDMVMLAGVLLLVAETGTSELGTIVQAAASGGIDTTLPAVLLLAGASAKSAQVPFQGWLPDAMVGPTPVSALLHSATMVAAGVFLVARLYPVFVSAPGALAVTAWMGLVTAIVGGLAALVEVDLKRTLAYSTMSQIGLMFLGLGAGSLVAGVLLLIGQALYKALLFLAAGVIEHHVGGTAFERMGGLGRRKPVLAVAFTVGALALAGIPVTVALPPKDPALAAAWGANGALFAGGLFAVFLTAAYSARMLALTLLGSRSPVSRSSHDVPTGLITTLVTLAALVPLGLLVDSAVLGRPLSTALGAEAPHAVGATLAALAASAFGLATGFAAWSRWPRFIIWPPLVRAAPVFASEFGFRPLYRHAGRFAADVSDRAAATDRLVFEPIGTVFATGARWATRLASTLDGAVFDPATAQLAIAARGAVRVAVAVDRSVFDAAAAWLARTALDAIGAARRFDLERVESAVRGFGGAVLAAGHGVRRFQTGRIENYLVPAFVWALVLIAIAAATGSE